MTLIFGEMSANASDSRAGLLPNTSLDAALTQTSTVCCPEMKDWKQNDSDLIKIACYVGVQNFQELRKKLYVPGR